LNQCPTCKAILEPGVRFCPNDGTPLTETAAGGSAAVTPTGVQSKSVELTLPTVVGGRYRLVERRGGGGMAKVYKAEDLTLQRIVAVKLINPELRTEQEFDARFQREARIASQLQDPHIVAVHDFGIDPTLGPYLVMEFLEGQSLRERLQAGGPLPLKAGLQIGGQMLLALTHAHEKGIVHRDIKPDNVFLVNQSGVRMHVRILDFGIARILRRDDPAHSHTLTSPGSVLGTPRYMSPEQLAGQQIDARSDLYSAAVVIHEALTGELPYVTGKRLCELCPEASAALQELLEHCLKPAPQDRPQTAVEAYLRMQEFAKASGVLLLPPGAIDAILRGRKGNPPAGSPIPTVAYTAPTTTVRSRKRILVGLAIVLVLFAGAALVKWYFFRATPPAAAESLLGVHIGDSRDVTRTKLGLKHSRTWTRWQQKPNDVSLGHVLDPQSDLGLSAEGLDDIDVSWTEDAKVVVLFHDDKVKAVIVHEPRAVATARNAGIGAAMRDLIDLYRDADPQTKTIAGDEELTAIRCDRVGVGFEMRKGKVTGIALYPPAAR
jgi:hypothetical protein